MKILALLLILSYTPCNKDYQHARRVYYKGVKNASYTTIKKSAELFYKLAVKLSDCELAPYSLFNAGKAYITLYTLRFEKSLAIKAKEMFIKLANTYPNHTLADDALVKIGNICRFILMDEKCASQYYKRAIYLNGDMVKVAKRALNSMYGKKESVKHQKTSLLQDINWWIAEKYIRVSLTFSERRNYSYKYIEANSGIRVIVYNAQTSRIIDKSFPSHTFIRRIKVYNKDGNTVIEVIGEELSGYQVFHFAYPFSVLIDAFRSDYHKKDKIASIIEEYEKKQVKKKKIPLVILDPGHGGHDPGAKGKRTVEKHITLKLAKLVKPLLEEKGIKVRLTRDNDIFIPLPMRTAIANSSEADLFVSIHINSSRNRNARGIEVYYFDKSIDPHILEVAARENAIEKISPEMKKELSFILADLQLTSKTMESALLAEEIENHILKHTSYKKYRYREVKGGPFYVLMNAKMPSVLVEVCFISNPLEEKMLTNKNFLQKVARGITNGIVSYLKRRKEI